MTEPEPFDLDSVHLATPDQMVGGGFCGPRRTTTITFVTPNERIIPLAALRRYYADLPANDDEDTA